MKIDTFKIKSIRKACFIADEAFEYILSYLKTGVTEKELAEILNKFLRSKSDGVAFKTIVAFEENTSNVHHKPTTKRLKEKDIVMLDFGAKINGYSSDITRTFVYKGVQKEKLNLIKEVKDAQEKAIEFIASKLKRREEVISFDVDKIARDFLLEKKYPMMPHSLGHGIGKKTHSGLRLSPNSKRKLKTGFFTIEPGVYIKGKFGARIEDTVFLNEGKLEILTTSKKPLTI